MPWHEWRATTGLAGIYAARMFGLFAILPVLVLYDGRLSGATPQTIGLAIGIYGLVQAVLQIPFGLWSDRVGRRRMIAFGLLLFIAGSLVAASAESVTGVIVGRALQGAGAIAAVVLALASDLIAEERRSRSMAVIGLTIGLTFTGSLVLAPLIDARLGLSGIFLISAGLGGLALLALWVWVPAASNDELRPSGLRVSSNGFLHASLLPLHYGAFALHATLAALFLLIPLWLRDVLTLDPAAHWRLYLPVMVASFVLMLPLVIVAERRAATRGVSLMLVALLATLVLVAWLWAPAAFTNGAPGALVGAALVVALVLFFVGFNALEATLPATVSKLAPLDAKGAALGVFTTAQFLGIFFGGSVGGVLLHHAGVSALLAAILLLLLVWLLVLWRTPPVGAVRTHVLTDVNAPGRLRGVDGVIELRFDAERELLWLKLDERRLSLAMAREHLGSKRVASNDSGTLPGAWLGRPLDG